LPEQLRPQCPRQREATRQRVTINAAEFQYRCRHHREILSCLGARKPTSEPMPSGDLMQSIRIRFLELQAIVATRILPANTRSNKRPHRTLLRRAKANWPGITRTPANLVAMVEPLRMEKNPRQFSTRLCLGHSVKLPPKSYTALTARY
jgi:hypothetical protein